MDNNSNSEREARVWTDLRLSCKHSKTFLNLPLSVRRRIYEEAGLTVGDEIVLHRRPKKLWNEAYHFIYRLLLTCRAIHDEVKYIICTENRIVVSHGSVEYGFYFLSKLPPQICSGLRDLCVHIYLEASPEGHTPYFTDSASLSQSRINAWHTAATHLLSHVEPQTLRLYLICDAGDSNKTRAVLQPLTDRPGILADCHIRLHHWKETRAKTIAEKAALQVKGLNSELKEGPFRFFDLPTELRYRILTYTDLVTPRSKIEWSLEKGFQMGRGPYYEVMSQAEIEASREHALPFLRCRSFNSTTTGSFCSARTSSYSSRCQCWIPPWPLMLVSWSMYRHAIKVLYSCNRVVVIPDRKADWANLGRHNMGERLTISRFMTMHARPEVLSHVRSIELLFPGFDTDAPPSTAADLVYADWVSAVEHVRAHAKLAAMTLIIHMRLSIGLSSSPPRVIGDRDILELYLAAHHGNKGVVLRWYEAFLEPLKALREGGLRRLFVFFEWGWYRPSWRGDGPRSGPRSDRHEVDRFVDDMEVELEKSVMGQAYDSSELGKMK